MIVEIANKTFVTFVKLSNKLAIAAYYLPPSKKYFCTK